MEYWHRGLVVMVLLSNSIIQTMEFYNNPTFHHSIILILTWLMLKIFVIYRNGKLIHVLQRRTCIGIQTPDFFGE